MLKTFNIVGYINKGELNESCGVSSICNSLHIELHLICSVVCCICHAYLNRTCIILVCASCHVYVVVVYYVVSFFPVLLLRVSSDNVAFVRIRSTSSVCLPSWTRSSSLRDVRQDDHTLEITSIFAC